MATYGNKSAISEERFIMAWYIEGKITCQLAAVVVVFVVVVVDIVIVCNAQHSHDLTYYDFLFVVVDVVIYSCHTHITILLMWLLWMLLFELSTHTHITSLTMWLLLWMYLLCGCCCGCCLCCWLWCGWWSELSVSDLLDSDTLLSPPRDDCDASPRLSADDSLICSGLSDRLSIAETCIPYYSWYYI